MAFSSAMLRTNSISKSYLNIGFDQYCTWSINTSCYWESIRQRAWDKYERLPPSDSTCECAGNLESMDDAPAMVYLPAMFVDKAPVI